MKLRTKLLDLAKAVADAADRDPELASRLTEIFAHAQAEKRSPARVADELAERLLYK